MTGWRIPAVTDGRRPWSNCTWNGHGLRKRTETTSIRLPSKGIMIMARKYFQSGTCLELHAFNQWLRVLNSRSLDAFHFWGRPSSASLCRKTGIDLTWAKPLKMFKGFTLQQMMVL